MFEGLSNNGPLEAPFNRCTHWTRCAALDSCDLKKWRAKKMLSGFPRNSWNYNLMTWLSFFKNSWSNITSVLEWPRPVVQLKNMPLCMFYLLSKHLNLQTKDLSRQETILKYSSTLTQ
jgi:hypothetical protein